MRLPTRVSPSPLIDAVVELRFDPQVPPDAVFGVIFNALSDRYQKYTRTAVSQIPAELRDEDPNLRFQPHYRAEAGGFVIQVGPRVLSVSAPNYPGWTVFSQEVMSVFSSIQEKNIIREFERLGMRYVNFLDGDFGERVRVAIEVGDQTVKDRRFYLRTRVANDGLEILLQITNEARLETNRRDGSVVDIDVISINPKLTNSSIFAEMLSLSHIEVKKAFFGLLSDDYMRSLNPEYDPE